MTLINPLRTHLFNINNLQTSTEKSLEKQAIFFGHTNGYISLFQGDLLTMEPILAHKTSIVCLETSQSSMEMSNITFTNCEILVSCSSDRLINLWDLTINKFNDSIQLIHLLTVEQEKNISFQSIKFLSMIDNFIVANYSDQKYLHIWQLLNISIRTDIPDQWGIVEHPTKGNHHSGQIQGKKSLFAFLKIKFHLAISAISKLKLFASSDTEGRIKIWDNTNSLIREICLDKSLCGIEFLSQNGELLIAYQNNIHLIFPKNYLLNSTKFKIKQKIIIDSIAEDERLEVKQLFNISYQSLPIFDYNIKTHHRKKRLQRFERQLAGDD
jgi:WD40 repeat protein